MRAIDRLIERALGTPLTVADPAPAIPRTAGGYPTPVLDRPIELPDIPLSTSATLPRVAACCEHRAVVLRLEDENAGLRARNTRLEGLLLNHRELWSSEDLLAALEVTS